jgi:hypothetical protein
MATRLPNMYRTIGLATAAGFVLGAPWAMWCDRRNRAVQVWLAEVEAQKAADLPKNRAKRDAVITRFSERVKAEGAESDPEALQTIWNEEVKAL